MELTSITTQHDLVINQLTMPIWNELCTRGEIVEDQLYLIDDTDGFDANNLPIRNVPEPELSGDAANKDYVDRLSDVYQEKGNYLTSHQSLSDYYTKSQTDALSTSFRNGLATSDSLTAYATKDYAATVGPVTKVNNQTGAVSVYVPTKLSEFTNDKNFISAVPDAYKTYSATVEALSDDGYATEDMLTKIRLDGTDTTEFNVVHISRDEYAAKVKADDGSILSNTLYVISSESINAYGQQLKNLAAPTDLSDAVTLEYADGHYLTAHQSLDNYYTKSQTNALSTTFRTGLATKAQLNEKITLSDLCQYYYYLDTSSLPASYRVGEFYAYKTNTENVYKSEVNFKQYSLELNEVTGGWKIYYNGSVARSGTAVKQSNGDFYESTLGFTIYRKLYANDSDMLDGMHLSAISANIIHSADLKYLHSDITSIQKLDHYSEKADIYKNGGITLDYTAKLTLVSDFGQIGILSGRSLQDELDKIPSISVDGIHTDELHLKHVSVQEYAQILEEGALSNALYVISSDENDMMGERIINVADPVELSDAATKNYVDNNIDKYILTTATLAECGDGLSCQVSNYTITTVAVPDPDTAISIMLPEQTSDNTVRDFMIRFENTGSENASIAFVPYGAEDIDYEGCDDDWATVEPGVNLISFTETKR